MADRPKRKADTPEQLFQKSFRHRTLIQDVESNRLIESKNHDFAKIIGFTAKDLSQKMLDDTILNLQNFDCTKIGDGKDGIGLHTFLIVREHDVYYAFDPNHHSGTKVKKNDFFDWFFKGCEKRLGITIVNPMLYRSFAIQRDTDEGACSLIANAFSTIYYRVNAERGRGPGEFDPTGHSNGLHHLINRYCYQDRTLVDLVNEVLTS